MAADVVFKKLVRYIKLFFMYRLACRDEAMTARPGTQNERTCQAKTLNSIDLIEKLQEMTARPGT